MPACGCCGLSGLSLSVSLGFSRGGALSFALASLAFSLGFSFSLPTLDNCDIDMRRKNLLLKLLMIQL
jgi:hypothetical protein